MAIALLKDFNINLEMMEAEKDGERTIPKCDGGYSYKCSICLSDLKDLAIGVCSPCAHVFCHSCIHKWTTEVNVFVVMFEKMFNYCLGITQRKHITKLLHQLVSGKRYLPLGSADYSVHLQSSGASAEPIQHSAGSGPP